jgi:hypothetical protein
MKGQQVEPAPADDDRDTLEQPGEIDEPFGLAKAYAGKEV